MSVDSKIIDIIDIISGRELSELFIKDFSCRVLSTLTSGIVKYILREIQSKRRPCEMRIETSVEQDCMTLTCA